MSKDKDFTLPENNDFIPGSPDNVGESEKNDNAGLSSFIKNSEAKELDIGNGVKITRIADDTYKITGAPGLGHLHVNAPELESLKDFLKG